MFSPLCLGLFYGAGYLNADIYMYVRKKLMAVQSNIKTFEEPSNRRKRIGGGDRVKINTESFSMILSELGATSRISI